MNARASVFIVLTLAIVRCIAGDAATVVHSGPLRRNNLVCELLEVASIARPGGSFEFARPGAGWIFVSAGCQGHGMVTIALDPQAGVQDILIQDAARPGALEAFRFVREGDHRLEVRCEDDARVEKLVVKAIPELIHCGLGFDPAIKSYGTYDLDFLGKDILPNVTTFIVPNNLELAPAIIDRCHRQGKRFIAEVGLNDQARTAEDHFRYWTGFLDKALFLDGIIINEFIVNNPSSATAGAISPERQRRVEQQRQWHRDCEAAFKRMRADDRYKDKMVYAYIGGSGKKLNQEIIGPTFVRTLIECGYPIALERYLFEVSSRRKSEDALRSFVEGIADWEAKEPGAKRNMVIAFGLFSMPPGSINKQPNVDYHVWMDQQMHVVANDPALSDIAGLEWWTSILADEETVRFVGRLYRHYAIEGQTRMLTSDPLFLTHVENADFENGTAGWTLQPAEPGTIAAKSFPRYGRIEGRYMGLGRPPDPEHIGDTFLWMKRSDKGPNAFSQEIKNLTPGRLYSLKMLSCDYQDLVHPTAKTMAQASKFLGRVELEGVDVDAKRSFTEMYASSPEPPIPVWITYHWMVFRARAMTARLTVSDWPGRRQPLGPFGQEQTFNFLEIQPYHE